MRLFSAIELIGCPDTAAVLAGGKAVPLLWRGVAASQQNLSGAEPVREGEKPVESALSANHRVGSICHLNG
jgi:hypothetical protein